MNLGMWIGIGITTLALVLWFISIVQELRGLSPDGPTARFFGGLQSVFVFGALVLLCLVGLITFVASLLVHFCG